MKRVAFTEEARFHTVVAGSVVRQIILSGVLTFLLLLSLPALTQSGSSQAPPQSFAETGKKTDSPTTFTAKEREELAVLRAQLQVMTSYDQRLLATVYWALGALGTLGAAIIGFGWFTNFKIYERDKDALRSALSADIQAELAKLRSELSAEVSKEIKGNLSQLERNVGILINKQKLLEIDQEMRVAEESKQKGLIKASLREMRRALQLAIQVEASMKVGEILDEMKAVLDILDAKRTVPDSDDTHRVMETLGKVPDSFQVTVDAIRQRLQKLHGPA
jgi:hypothetical protein